MENFIKSLFKPKWKKKTLYPLAMRNIFCNISEKYSKIKKKRRNCLINQLNFYSQMCVNNKYFPQHWSHIYCVSNKFLTNPIWLILWQSLFPKLLLLFCISFTLIEVLLFLYGNKSTWYQIVEAILQYHPIIGA